MALPSIIVRDAKQNFALTVIVIILPVLAAYSLYTAMHYLKLLVSHQPLLLKTQNTQVFFALVHLFFISVHITLTISVTATQANSKNKLTF